MLTLFLEGKTGYFSNSFPTNKKTNMKLFLVSMAPKGKASEKQPGYFSDFFLNSEPHPPTYPYSLRISAKLTGFLKNFI